MILKSQSLFRLNLNNTLLTNYYDLLISHLKQKKVAFLRQVF